MITSLSNLTKDELLVKVEENNGLIKKLNQRIELLDKENSIYKELFDNSPTPMWEEDITELISYLREKKKEGIQDFIGYFDSNPNELENCIKKIKVININEATMSLHKAKSKSELLENLEKVFTEKSIEAFKIEIAAIANGAMEYECETNVITFEGDQVDLKLYLKITERYEDEALKYFALVSTIDITKQKNAENKLISNEKILRTILDTSNDMALLVDNNGFIIEGNKACQEQFGVKRVDMIGRKLNHFATEDFLEQRRKIFQKAIESKKSVTHQDKAYGKYWTSTISPLLDDHGNVEKVVIFHKDVSLAHMAKIKIEESEAKYKSIFNNIQMSVTHIDKYGYITDINDFHINEISQNKFAKQDFIGSNIIERKSILRAGISDHYKNLLNGIPFKLNNVYFPETTGGSDDFFNLLGIPLFLNNDFNGAIITFDRVTDEVRGKRELEKIEERLRIALEGSSIGLWDHNLETDEIWRSDQWYQMLGYQNDAFGNHLDLWTKILHPDDFENTMSVLNNYMKNQTDEIKIEHRLKDSNGDYKWILNWGRVIKRSENGSPMRIAGIHMDITDGKNTEMKLQEQVENNQQILDTTMDGYILANAKGEILDVNPAYCEITGYTKEELCSMNIVNLESRPSPDGIQDRINYMLKQGSARFMTNHKSKGGNDIALDVSIAVTNKGETPFISAFVRDITKRQKSEQELSISRARYESLFNNSPIPLWEESFGELQKYLEEIKENGVDNLAEYFKNNPHELIKCSQKVKIVNINYAAQKLHNANSKEELMGNLEKIFTEKSLQVFMDEVIALDRGLKEFETEGEVQTLDGIRKHVSLKLIINDQDPNNRTGVLATIDITERKKAEYELQASQERFNLAMKASQDGIYDLDLITNEVYYSPGWKNMLGYSIDELGDQVSTWTELMFDEELEGVREVLQEVIDGKRERFELEFKMMHKDGYPIDILSRGNVIKNDEGKAIRIVGTHVNITQLKEVENALRKSETKYRMLVENQTDLVVEVDSENKFTFVSPSYCKLFGKSELELIGHSFFPLIHEDDREATALEMEKLNTAPFICRIEQRALTKNGWKWLEWSDRAIVDSNNLIKSIVGVGRDITDKKVAENALRQSKEKFSKLFQTSPYVLIISNLKDGKILEINDYGLKAIGLSKEEIIDKTSLELELVSKENRQILRNRIQNFGYYDDLEFPVKLPNGEERIGLFHGKLLRIDDQDCIFQTILDITDRKRIEKEIEEKEINVRAILNASMDAIVMLEKNGKIIETNNIFAQLVGKTRAELNGENIFNHLDSETIENRRMMLRKVLQSKKSVIFTGKAFQKTWEFSIYPIQNPSGKVNRLTIFAKDITEKHYYEEKLKESNERLRNLSRHLNKVGERERKNIAREVHDNLGQKLTALNLEISWIKQNIPQELSSISEQFDPVMDLVNQSIVTVQEISTELRPGILDDLGLVNAIQWQCNKVSRKSDLKFKLDLSNEEIDLSDEIKTVLFRVFQEALTNIIRHSKAKNIYVNLKMRDNHLLFSIIDDGIGIPLNKLNDFTSFGIIGMKERIESINGIIEIANIKLGGTEILISVPISEET